ncbi:hypothetical protein BC829DRAFT_143905 [Chytridium lagenaria]|nr:hypothetical protein BC829DRAFT_143905 [Chytridium lagenaria]
MASITSAEEIPSVAVDGKPQGVQQQDASVIVSHASEQQDVAASIPVEPQVPLAAEQQALPELTGEKENAAAPVVVAADQSGPSDQVDQSNVSAAADEDLDETVVSLQELLLGGQGSPRVFTDEDGVSDITSNAVEAASVQDPSSIEVFEAEEVSVNEGVEVVEESISLEDLTEGSPEPTEPESTLSLAPEPVEPIEESISLEDLTEGTPEPTEPEASGSVASAKPVTSPAKPRTTSDSLSNAGPQPRKGLARNPSGKRNDKPRASNEGERPVSTREAKPVLGADGNPEVRKPAPAPYVNPNRVASGGLEKKKLSPEELDRKMEEMRLKNAEILRKKEVLLLLAFWILW